MSRRSPVQRHMDRVAQLDCGVCGWPAPSELHHILEGRTPGARSPDMLVIPLCASCHRSNLLGIHGQRRMWDVYKLSELDVLHNTLLTLYGRIT